MDNKENNSIFKSLLKIIGNFFVILAKSISIFENAVYIFLILLILVVLVTIYFIS